MFKREIKYKNFDDEEVTDILWFHLTKTELITMQVDVEGGLGKFLQKIIDETNEKEVFKMIKDILLLSYGEKSPDGKRFIKSDELRQAFSQSLPYEILMTEFMVDSEAAAKFIEGVLPEDIDEFVKKLKDQDKPATPTASQT